MKIYQLFAGLSVAVFVPSLVSAQNINTGFVDELVQFVSSGVNTLIPLLIGIAVLFFIYGLVMFILAADDEDARKKARNKMVWGIITIFVMVSVWGLVNVLGSFFNLDTTVANPPDVPVVPSL